MAATAPRAGGSAPEAAASAEAPLQYSLLLQYLVGDKRQPRLLEPGSLGGIPSPAKSEEQKMIERAMESCAFKAALACVGGEAGPGGDLWEAEGLGGSGIHCSEDHAPRRRGGPGPRDLDPPHLSVNLSSSSRDPEVVFRLWKFDQGIGPGSGPGDYKMVDFIHSFVRFKIITFQQIITEQLSRARQWKDRMRDESLVLMKLIF